MTDTARTLAEVKALLADNTTRDISPQDLRDLVESIVDPVPGGGFGPTIGYDEAALTVLDGQGSQSPFTLSPNTSAIVPLRILKDPNGWVIPDAYTTGSYNIPANSSWVLPPGIYSLSTDFLVNPSIPTTSGFYCSFEWTDWNVVASVNDDIWGAAGFYYPAHGTGSRLIESIGVFRSTQAMYDAGQGICVRASNDTVGTPMVFNYCDVLILKLV